MHDSKNPEHSSPNDQLLGGYTFICSTSKRRSYGHHTNSKVSRPQLLFHLCHGNQKIMSLPFLTLSLTHPLDIEVFLKITQMCLVPVLERLTHERLEAKQHL